MKMNMDVCTKIGKTKMVLNLLDIMSSRIEDMREEVIDCQQRKKKVQIPLEHIELLKSDINILASGKIANLA